MKNQTIANLESEETKNLQIKNQIFQETSKIIAAIFILGTLNSPVNAQDKSSADSTKNVPAKSGSFAIDPTYSPQDNIGTFRLSGWWSISGINAWWFLDLSWNDFKEGINSAFGKLTLSKSTDKIIKWTSVAIEYMLDFQSPDKVRGWLIYGTKIWNGSIGTKLYPVSDKWFDPYAVVFVNQKIWEKIKISSFLNNDITNKKYYGETEATYKINSNIDALLQARYGGMYGKKCNPSWYIGARINF